MPRQSLSKEHIFSKRYITGFLHLAILDNTSALLSGGTLTIKKKKKSPQIQKVCPQRLQKGCLLTVWELKQGRVSVDNWAPSDSKFSPPCTCPPKTTGAFQVLLLEL
jgi:hypothetical protein